MCTWIVEKADIMGSGKGASGWFPLKQANVCYDHPAHAPLDHAVLIDFVNPDQGIGARDFDDRCAHDGFSETTCERLPSAHARESGHPVLGPGSPFSRGRAEYSLWALEPNLGERSGLTSGDLVD